MKMAAGSNCALEKNGARIYVTPFARSVNACHERSIKI